MFLILDTSESLNFISPSSTREDFTSGITERCRKIQHTQPLALAPKLILNQPMINRSTTTTAYFDIDSGKISTIVSCSNQNGRYTNGSVEKFLSTKTIELSSPTIVSHANKKPSYLNLACCVNGYSNYTNYDSQERREINKSREVSPIRPIISMARQPRSNDNLLSIPTFVKQSPLTSITKRFAGLTLNDKDTTDNAAMINGNGTTVTNRKSFIQQRVEKLYGTTKILTTTKSSDSFLNGNSPIHQHHTTNGTTNTNGALDEKENDEVNMNSLPVMKHLRPEFAKQLQFIQNSPKKTIRPAVPPKSNDLTSILPPTTATTIESNEISSKTNLLNSELNKEKIVMEPVVNNATSVDEPDKLAVVNNNCDVSNKNLMNINVMEASPSESNDSSQLKDGNYFLTILELEKTRILEKADDTEKELQQLQNDVSVEK